MVGIAEFVLQGLGPVVTTTVSLVLPTVSVAVTEVAWVLLEVTRTLNRSPLTTVVSKPLSAIPFLMSVPISKDSRVKPTVFTRETVNSSEVYGIANRPRDWDQREWVRRVVVILVQDPVAVGVHVVLEVGRVADEPQNDQALGKIGLTATRSRL